MNKQDNFNKIYLDLIEQSNDWRDSLGGKLVTGIGSLFKGGAKGISSLGSSINKGANATANAAMHMIKNAKIKKNFKESVERIKSVYNPITSDLNTLLNNKDQLIYIINSSKDAMPGQLSQFFDIFTNVGKQMQVLIQNNPDILKSSNVQQLITQPLLAKVQKFKQKYQAKYTVTVNQNNSLNIYESAYLTVISQQSTSGIAQDAFNEFQNLDYIVDNDTVPYKLHKQYNNTQLSSILNVEMTSGNCLYNYRDFISNDKLVATIEITSNIIKYMLKSEANQTDFQKQFQVTNDINKINSNFKQALIEFYQFADAQISRKKNLKNAKYSQYSAILMASNIAIDNIKWTGLFGSLKRILKQAAACNLNIDDIKILAKAYFHVALIS